MWPHFYIYYIKYHRLDKSLKNNRKGIMTIIDYYTTIVVEQGPQGPQGPMGKPGPQGPRGPSDQSVN